MEEAWRLLIQSADSLEGVQPFLYDLVDVGRQVRPCWHYSACCHARILCFCIVHITLCAEVLSMQIGLYCKSCASCDTSPCVVSLQVISKLATGMWNATAEEYTARAAQRMQQEGQRLLDLLDDLDELLATQR